MGSVFQGIANLSMAAQRQVPAAKGAKFSRDARPQSDGHALERHVADSDSMTMCRTATTRIARRPHRAASASDFIPHPPQTP
jgi:hypothetical protein